MITSLGTRARCPGFASNEHGLNSQMLERRQCSVRLGRGKCSDKAPLDLCTVCGSVPYRRHMDRGGPRSQPEVEDH